MASPNGAQVSCGQGRLSEQSINAGAVAIRAFSCRRQSAATRDYTESAGLDHVGAGPSVPMGRPVGGWSAGPGVTELWKLLTRDTVIVPVQAVRVAARSALAAEECLGFPLGREVVTVVPDT